MKHYYRLLALLISLSCLMACSTTTQPTNTNQQTPVQRESQLIAEKEKEFQLDKKFYYHQLETEEKFVYLQLKEGLSTFQEDISIKVKAMDEHSFYKILQAFLNDNPEYFWFHNYTLEDSIHPNSYRLSIPTPEDVRETAAEIESIAEQILQGMPKDSPYEQVRYLYEYIIKETSYDLAAPNNQDIRSVFLGKTSVCAGYSQAFQYLAEKAGLTSIVVTGRIHSIPIDNPYHAWNMVQISEHYYWVDTTWGDPAFEAHAAEANPASQTPDITYDYLCVPDELLQRTHSPETTVAGFFQETSLGEEPVWNFPACPDNSLNTYVLQGSYFDQYDLGSLQQYIISQINAGQQPIHFQFATQAGMEAANHDLGNSTIIQYLVDYYQKDTAISWIYNTYTYAFQLTVE